MAGEVNLVLFSNEKGELAPPKRGLKQPEKYALAEFDVTVVPGETLDLGDIPLALYRTAHGTFGAWHPYEQPGGVLAFEIDREQARSKHKVAAAIRVTKVVPDGSAAKVGLTVGDVIVAVDGHDVRGRRSYLYETLSTAPEGTLIGFELERGETIAIEAGEAPEVKVFL